MADPPAGRKPADGTGPDVGPDARQGGTSIEEMGSSIMASAIKGILGSKLGMTQVFDEANRVVPVTVVKAGPVVVTAVRSSTRCRRGETPAFAKWPPSGRFTLRGSISPKPSWTAE